MGSLITNEAAVHNLAICPYYS